MAKVQIKSEKLTSFGGIFPIMEKFDRMPFSRQPLVPLSQSNQAPFDLLVYRNRSYA